MYGFSNDWYFATGEDGIDPLIKGEASAIAAVPNPNAFTTLPEIKDIVRVIIK